jgi:hypothetical protein
MRRPSQVTRPSASSQITLARVATALALVSMGAFAVGARSRQS